jgi:hypothetical protein
MQIRVAEVFADPGPGRSYLEVDGKEYGGVDVSFYHAAYKGFTKLSARTPRGSEFLSHLAPHELPTEFGRLEVPLEFEWRDLKTRAVLERHAKPTFAFELHADLSRWSGALTFSMLTDMVTAVVAAIDHPELSTVAVSRSGYFSIGSHAHPGTIADNVRSRLDLLGTYRDEVERRIADRGGLTFTFTFPPQATVACQQYLLYFAEFLRDVGIDANTSVREEAGRVLFSVVPADVQTALDAIREALAVYLSLPVAELAPDTANDIEIMKLSANIHHLKGQIELARALLMSQSSTIEAQKLALDLQHRLLEPDFVKASDREQLFGGIITVKPYESKGFDINLAEVFRRLRKSLRR